MDLPFIQGLLPQNCWEQQPKAQRQMANWIWAKDEIVVFESQPGEAARAAQMFPFSFWQRRHQEGKGQRRQEVAWKQRGKGRAAALKRTPLKVPSGHPGLQHACGFRAILGPFHKAGAHTCPWEAYLELVLHVTQS